MFLSESNTKFGIAQGDFRLRRWSDLRGAEEVAGTANIHPQAATPGVPQPYASTEALQQAGKNSKTLQNLYKCSFSIPLLLTP